MKMNFWGKRGVAYLIVFYLFFSCHSSVQAQVVDTADADTVRAVCALFSTAAYQDRYGQLTRKILQTYHWKIYSYDRYSERSSVKFLVAHNSNFHGEDAYCIAFAGTSDIYDVRSDLDVKLVPFASGKRTEYVHQGFQRYAQVAWNTPLSPVAPQLADLATLLKQYPNRHLYLTGHSLGGAVAILTACYFLEQGVPPTQINVVTFGAPAVGNTAFASYFAKRLHFTNVIMRGDPVRNLAQIANSDYELFGTRHYYPGQSSYGSKVRHKMLLYLDAALREYYRQLKSKKGDKSKIVFLTEPEVSIANAHLKEQDWPYLAVALQNVADSYFSSVGQRDLIQHKIQLRPTVIINQQRDTENYNVYLLFSAYNVDEQWLGTLANGCDTAELTPLEAVLYNSTVLMPEVEELLVSRHVRVK